MAYQHLEELKSRKDEKIATLLTLQNLAGLACGFIPAYILTAQTPLVLRAAILIVASLLGISATVEVRGQAFYERVIWRVRGSMRMAMHRKQITPAQLPGVVIAARHDPTLRADALVQPAPDDDRRRTVAASGVRAVLTNDDHWAIRSSNSDATRRLILPDGDEQGDNRADEQPSLTIHEDNHADFADAQLPD